MAIDSIERKTWYIGHPRPKDHLLILVELVIHQQTTVSYRLVLAICCQYGQRDLSVVEHQLLDVALEIPKEGKSAVRVLVLEVDTRGGLRELPSL